MAPGSFGVFFVPMEQCGGSGRRRDACRKSSGNCKPARPHHRQSPEAGYPRGPSTHAWWPRHWWGGLYLALGQQVGVSHRPCHPSPHFQKLRLQLRSCLVLGRLPRTAWHGLHTHFQIHIPLRFSELKPLPWACNPLPSPQHSPADCTLPMGKP